jgi:DtxR family Mn-dependent transcriptional regulator
MPSQTKENYLKALYFLSREGEKISLTELSREMGVSTPTANSMVKKLQEKGWVIYQKYKPLELTNSGRKTAALIIRKHRLAEMYLVERMGFGWEEVHDIAEEMEHIDSELLFDRMDELLGYPSADPHGSPIPDKEGKVAIAEHHKLSEAEAGSKVRLEALRDSSTEFLLFLNTKKLELGTEIDILHIEPFDKSITVSYNELAPTMLSHEVCERLLVEKVNA